MVGAGAFGRNHIRVLRTLPGVTLAAVVDAQPDRAAQAAAEAGCPSFTAFGELTGRVDAAVVAVPTVAHAEVACHLLESGIDVLVEKPIAPDLSSASRIKEAARRAGRVLQVGHLERFNPAIEALSKIVNNPLFFEIHRLSVFSLRSLDVDVVLDLMIHDIEILLALTGQTPAEIRAVGLPVLSDKVDIANVRLAFANGCVANLTASRVSTERVRKLRLFQPHQYISLDYQRQDAACFSVSPERQIGFEPLPIVKEEPLQRELAHFVHCVQTRTQPLVDGEAGIRALEVSLAILGKIKEHGELIAPALASWATSAPESSS